MIQTDYMITRRFILEMNVYQIRLGDPLRCFYRNGDKKISEKILSANSRQTLKYIHIISLSQLQLLNISFR